MALSTGAIEWIAQHHSLQTEAAAYLELVHSAAAAGAAAVAAAAAAGAVAK